MLNLLKNIVGMDFRTGSREKNEELGKHSLGVPLTEVVIVTSQGTYQFQIDKMFLQPESSTVMMFGRE